MRQLLAGLSMLLLSSALYAAGLEGTWSGTLDGEPLILRLDAGGNGQLNGEPIQYQVLGSLLVVVDGDGMQSYQYTLKGDRLQVAGGTLAAPLTLSRGTAAAKASKPGPSAATPKATAAGELAGKWCWISNFNANQGGGSQTSRCFELRPDGSYVYDYDSSASAYSGGNSGLYGGTSSSSHDEGRWSVGAGTLTAQSSSGNTNTYRLEKRNHPKNRDPMICLDGDCYVTYWNKAPW